ncbi:MAG: hypothetical protein ACI83H_002814 [Glaciecola sp.]|jgi:hypothetical protein
MKSWNWKYLKKLVRTFSLNEKRFLKSQTVPVKTRITKDYSEVYDKIIKDNLLCEEEFKNSIGKKNLSFEKAKFAKKLFSHLRNYHEGSSIEISLHNALCDIEILFTKQLYEFCFEVINYNIKISVHHQMYELTLQFAKWKRRCLSRIDNIKLTKNQLKELNELDKECYFQLNILSQLRIVQQELVQIINKKGNSFDEEDRKKSLQLLSRINIDSSKVNSLTAQAVYNEINSWVAYYVHNDNNLALEYNTNSYKLFKKSKHLIAVYPQMFLSIYCSYYTRSVLNKRENTSHILAEIKELQVTKKINIPEDVRVQAFMFTSEAEMLRNIDSEKFQETIDLSKQHNKYLSKHSSYIKKSYVLIQQYCIGLAHFNLKEFTLALRYTKQNIDEFNDTIRLDYYMYNLTLNFIIHIELENFHIYKHLNSTYKHAVKKHGLQDLEEGIYASFFHQFVKKANSAANLYLETYEALEAFDSTNKKGAYDIHLSKWFLEKDKELKKLF